MYKCFLIKKNGFWGVIYVKGYECMVIGFNPKTMQPHYQGTINELLGGRVITEDDLDGALINRGDPMKYLNLKGVRGDSGHCSENKFELVR